MIFLLSVFGVSLRHFCKGQVCKAGKAAAFFPHPALLSGLKNLSELSSRAGWDSHHMQTQSSDTAWGCNHLYCFPHLNGLWMMFSRRDLTDFSCCWGIHKITQGKDKANYVFCLSIVMFPCTCCQCWVSCWYLRKEKKVMKLWVQSSSNCSAILIWGLCQVYNYLNNHPDRLQLLD